MTVGGGTIRNSFHVIHAHPQFFHKLSTPELALDGRSPDPLCCQRFSGRQRIPTPAPL